MEILYKNESHTIPERIINDLKKFGIEFNDEYIEFLLSNKHPWKFNTSLSLMALFDVANRKFIGNNSILGRIIQLDEKGNPISYFDDVYSAAIASTGNNKFCFENLNFELISDKKSFSFFGLTIKINIYNNPLNKELNSIIRTCKGRLLGKKKSYYQWYTEGNIAKEMTYEEYLNKAVKYYAFQSGSLFEYDYNTKNKTNKYTEHNIEKCYDYEERMDSLFKRYSYKGESSFRQINDLNTVKDLSGIYLLCLPQIKGCYVGKTEIGFAKRISQHFTKPNSAFDSTYKPDDIRQIYILPMDESLPYVGLVEQDCIATLGSELCLNALAGGDSIELIKSNDYDYKKHLIPLNAIQFIAEDSRDYYNWIMDIS